MAIVTTHQDDTLPIFDTDVAHVQKQISVSAETNGDFLSVFALPQGHKGRVVGCVVRTSATLGAGATVQAQIGDGTTNTSITDATTAGAADKVDDSAQAAVPIDSDGGDIIGLLVGGANITSAATITVDVFIAPSR